VLGPALTTSVRTGYGIGAERLGFWRALKAGAGALVTKAGLGGIVGKTSRHSSGEGFDMSIQGYSQKQITRFAKKCGLKRLLGIKGEETHFNL
jgi:hypothetical protein